MMKFLFSIFCFLVSISFVFGQGGQVTNLESKPKSLKIYWYSQNTQGEQVANFGSNPGNLKMYLYSPSGLSSDAPLVVAMHGCGQTASQFSNNTDWNYLADTYGFHVIYPEKSYGACFTWWNGTQRDNEATSIKNMIDYTKNNLNISDCDVYATGFSAGGGMTSVMCALYPDVFAGGAIMSGMPTGISAINSGLAMSGYYNGWSYPWGISQHSPVYWGDQIRNEHSPVYSGNWPKMISFQGSYDMTVDDNNQDEIMQQWTNVHSVGQTADNVDNSFNSNWNVTSKEYHDGNGDWAVKTYAVSGLGHAIAVDLYTGNAGPEGGSLGSYAYHVDGLWSSYWTAVDWGLTTGACNSSARIAPINANNKTNTDFTIAPNPVTDYIILKGNSISKENTNKVQFYDMKGQLIKENTYKAGTELLVNDLESGLYILVIENEIGRNKTKFFKL